jgi:hypothetical protein
MGCSQSQLATATLSQAAPPADQQQLPARQRSGKAQPAVRVFEPDPAKAAQAADDKAHAVAAAEALLGANAGARHRDTYVRATLASYGASCRVFTAANKHTDEPVAIKTITKVWMFGLAWLGAAAAPPSRACLALRAMCAARVPTSACALAHIAATQSTKAPELQRSRVLQEIGAMLRVQHHPHAVRLLDAYEDERGFHLVMPLMKGEGVRGRSEGSVGRLAVRGRCCRQWSAQR